MVKSIHNNAGFTLVEVLIALVVFVVGILGLGLMQMSAITGNATANQVTEATVFAGNQIERMMAWPYDDPQLKASNNVDYTLPNDASYTADGHQADAADHYHAYWDVTDDTPHPDSKTIVVTVMYAHKGELKRISLSTVKARK